MTANYSLGSSGSRYELETEIRRVILLIQQAEERLQVQQRLLSEIRANGIAASQAEATMRRFQELIDEFCAHLADLVELQR